MRIAFIMVIVPTTEKNRLRKYYHTYFRRQVIMLALLRSSLKGLVARTWDFSTSGPLTENETRTRNPTGDRASYLKYLPPH